MIRLRPRCRWRALDNVKAAHLPGIGITAAGEIARIARHARESSREEIGVERDDYICFREIVGRLNRLPKGHACAFINVVAIDRLPEMPFGFRECLLEL